MTFVAGLHAAILVWIPLLAALAGAALVALVWR
jgi:hypothetical protein